MTNYFTFFNYEEKGVKIIVKNGEPWFYVSDVAEVLEINNIFEVIKKIDDDELKVGPLTSKEVELLISVPGLYFVLLNIRKPEAKLFKQWVIQTVIPTIRKDNAYMELALTLFDAMTSGEIEKTGNVQTTERDEFEDELYANSPSSIQEIMQMFGINAEDLVELVDKKGIMLY